MVYDVIPKFIKQAYEGKPLTIYGDGSQSRDFTCVYDIIEGFLRAGVYSGIEGEVVNIGSGITYSILNVAESIRCYAQITWNKEPTIKFLEPRLAEVKCLVCDNSKAEKLLSWKPSTSFEECLLDSINWLKGGC